MKISIIGAGNMAHQLGNALHRADHDIVEIYNRSHKRGAALATQLDAKAIRDIDDLNYNIDIIVIAVSDDAIAKVSRSLANLKSQKAIIVHTSGSVPSTVLKAHASFGVFYPFQSMTAGQDLNFREVPILVHSDQVECSEKLLQLANSISDAVHSVSDEQRGVVHLAGVFANNFSNHMMALANGILGQNQLSLEIIKPLIANSLNKILVMDPKSAQTGPAIRKDKAIMQKHLEALKDQPKLQNLYQLISESIMDLHDSKDSSLT